MRLFFFGTLMDPDVLRMVLGRDWPAHKLEEAAVVGFRRVYVAGANYPMLTPHHASGTVWGILARNLDREAVWRLTVFEGPEYHLVPIHVMDAHGYMKPAAAFMCDRQVAASRHDWHLDVWRRRHKRLFLRRAGLLMDHYGGQAMLRRLKATLPIGPKRKDPKHLFGIPSKLGRAVVNG